jgi:hypothetical protein
VLEVCPATPASGRRVTALPDHGTRSRYVHHGCRCHECREANTTGIRDYRHTGSTRPAPVGRGATLTG